MGPKDGIRLCLYKNHKVICGHSCKKTFTLATASVLVIGLLALVVMVSTYNSNSAAGVGYGSNSQPTLRLAGQGIDKNAFQLSAKLDNSINPPFQVGKHY